MFLAVWKFIRVVLTALLLATTLAHALEMPQKMSLPGPMWLALQQTLVLPLRAGYAGEVS